MLIQHILVLHKIIGHKLKPWDHLDEPEPSRDMYILKWLRAPKFETMSIITISKGDSEIQSMLHPSHGPIKLPKIILKSIK